MGRIGPNEVSGCPNRLSGAGGEPGCGGGYGAAGESAGRCRDASLRGLRTGRRRRSFRGGGEAAGWGERVCRCGEWGLGGCRAARFENGAMVVQFPGRRRRLFQGGDGAEAEVRRCVVAGFEDGAEAVPSGTEGVGWPRASLREWGQGRCRAARFKNGAMVVQFPGRRCFRGRDEALGWGESWVSVSGDLSRGCVAQHAALWCRLCRAGPPCVMSRGGRSEREREGKLDRDRVFGAVNWSSGATHRGRRVTRRAAACRAGARGRGACA